MTPVSDIMTRDILVLPPRTTVRDAALRMAQEGLGTVLIADEQEVFGIVTDRDITIRAATQDRSPADYSVEEVMSRDLKFVYEQEDIEMAASTMAKLKVRRLAVLNKDKRLVGVISLADIAALDNNVAQQALHDVSIPEVRSPAPTGGHDVNITTRPQLKDSSQPEPAERHSSSKSGLPPRSSSKLDDVKH